MRHVVLVAFVVAACGALPVQAKTLSIAYHSGDTYRYSFHATSKQSIDVNGATLSGEVDLTAAEAVKINSVDSTGVSDLTLTLTNFVLKSTYQGGTNTATGIPTMTMNVKVAADGRIVSMDGSQLAADDPFLAFSGMGGGFFVTAVMPGTPVKPGDTWSNDYSQANPGGSAAIQISSHSKYLRDESLGGVNAAVVETTNSGSIDINLTPAAAGSKKGLGGSIKGTMTSVVTTWIDPNDHRVLKTRTTESNEGTITFDPSTAILPWITGPMSIKGTGTTDLNPA